MPTSPTRCTPRIARREEWLRERLALLHEEKELTRRRDALSAARRALPWVPVEREYTFVTPDGTRTLDGLFDGRTQLIVNHFMFGPVWARPLRSAVVKVIRLSSVLAPAGVINRYTRCLRSP